MNPAAVDPRLDAVRSAHDPECMRALLAAWFARAGRPVGLAAVAVERIYYVPGSDFSATYRLELASGGEREAALLYGSIRYEGDAARLAAKAVRKADKGKFVQPRLGAPAYHLPELDMVLWTFPNDPRLKTLRANLEPGAVRAALAHVGRGQASGRELGAVHQTLVRYIPRKRCVFRYGIEWRGARAADGSPAAEPPCVLQQVYGKVYDDQAAGQHAHAVLVAMERAAAADRRWLRVPQALYYDAELRTAWQEALPGAHLARAAGRVTEAQAADIGRGLALLQLADLPVRPRLALEDEHEKLRLHAGLVASVHPEFAPRLGALAERLAASLGRLPRLPLVPAHGTFKLNHLLGDGERIGLVDFDSMAMADPLYDVANFVSDLHYLEASGGLPPGGAAGLARAFYDAWAAAVPWGRRDGVLDWYVASLLVRKQAFKCVKHLHADARAKIAAVLGAAEERLRRTDR